MKNNSRLTFLAILGMLITAACFLTDAIYQQELKQPADQSEPAVTIQTAVPTAAPTKDPWKNVEIRITGEEEVVFDWTTDRCDTENTPDFSARAYRDAQGQVHLFLSHFDWYRMSGPNLDSLQTDCTLLKSSAKNPDPSVFMDREWLGSIYTEDGQNLYVLVHNEYQGDLHESQCPQNDSFACLYNTITSMVSRDGGATYEYFPAPPGHLIASLPYPYEAGAGPYGLRQPSNIVKARDGYYYVFLNSAAYRSDEQHACLMRTDNLADPASWRFWEREGFNGDFINPYTEQAEDKQANICPAFMFDQIGAQMTESVTYNTAMDRYVLVGISADTINGREVWGFYYSTSKDMLNWTRRKLLLELPLPWTVNYSGTDLSYLYPSLLDPDSASISFDTTDESAYLYYTRLNRGQGSLDRDLIRVPVEFIQTE